MDLLQTFPLAWLTMVPGMLVGLLLARWSRLKSTHTSELWFGTAGAALLLGGVAVAASLVNQRRVGAGFALAALYLATSLPWIWLYRQPTKPPDPPSGPIGPAGRAFCRGNDGPARPVVSAEPTVINYVKGPAARAFERHPPH